MAALRETLSGDARNQFLVDAAKDYTARPITIEAVHAHALILVAWRRFREARSCYTKALASHQSSAWLHIDAGWCFHLLGDHKGAKDHFERALALDDANLAAKFGLGAVELSLGDFASARECFRKVADVDERYPDVLLNVASAEAALGNVAIAEFVVRRAIDVAPSSAAAWCLFGRVLKLLGRDSDAFAAYTRARTCEIETGDDARTTALHSVALVETGRQAEAIELCERVLPVDPDSSINTSYALALLTSGRLSEGWQQYEFRWFEEPMLSHRVRYDRPIWRGQPLQGKTIVIRAEQGIGDVIQFARYATRLKSMGAGRVVLHVHAGMGRLAANFVDVDEAPERLNLPVTFDFYVHLMSLPAILCQDVQSIPNRVPYLHVSPIWRTPWLERLSTSKLRVGLVWAGNPKHLRDRDRSIPLRLFEPLWTIDAVRFISLQKEIRSADLEYLPSDLILDNLGPDLQDLTDAAAVIESLDLVIAVDTSMAHLAGALGKPVWLLVPAVADFRWLEHREDTPWYPTMRLLRQQNPGEWTEVIERVSGMLRSVVSGITSFLDAPVSPATCPIQRSAPNTAIARVIEGRDGIFEYLPEIDDEARSLAHYGEYVPVHLDLLSRIIPIDAWVLEVGAGIGSHAVWMARVLGSDAEIFLYEPRYSVNRVLRQNLTANALIDRVTMPRGYLVGSILEASGERYVDPPPHRIDDLRLDRLDLLKIQSGNVLTLLDGAEDSIWRLRPRLFVLPSDSTMELRIVARIRSFGYRTWRIESRLFSDKNFNAMMDDCFEGRQIVAILGTPEESPPNEATLDLQEIA